MTTTYTLNDHLPKDGGGQKFAGLVNAATSQLDFALPKGIGASTIGSKILAHAAIGTHTQGSRVEFGHPGVLPIGVYMEDPLTNSSPVTPGRAQLARMTQFGELGAAPTAKNASLMTTSRNMFKAGSGILYGFSVAFAGVTAGDSFGIEAGTARRFTAIANGANGVVGIQIPEGGAVISTSMVATRTISGGAASVMVSYR